MKILMKKKTFAFPITVPFTWKKLTEKPRGMREVANSGERTENVQ